MNKLYEILEKINQELIDKNEYLTDLDRRIGDADHGTNMVRGWNLALEEIKQKKLKTVSETIEIFGKTLLNKVGGASGPLYGIIFFKGSKSINSELINLNHENFKSFVISGTKHLENLGKARLNDKTMLDVWKPFCQDLEKNLDKSQLLNNIKKYKDETEFMIAKKGRASFLGERSKGTIDPGSASTEIILRHFILGIY